MRIKINDKIYRLKEIESGVDSLMELVEEPKCKDGEFVVNMRGRILIFKKKVGNRIYNHAYFIKKSGEIFLNYNPTITQIERYATEEEKQKMLDVLAKAGKRWNEEKKCIEDIPKHKFKKGDKVVLKSGYKKSDGLIYLDVFDLFIGNPLTIRGYTDTGYVYFFGSPYYFQEDWLEPYEELKKGDLAIFWDSDQAEARIGAYNQFYHGSPFPHEDHIGNGFRNAIKFESKEQYGKLIKGEL